MPYDRAHVVRVRETGTSLAVTIPAALCELLDVRKGDHVILTPVYPPRKGKCAHKPVTLMIVKVQEIGQ